MPKGNNRKGNEKMTTPVRPARHIPRRIPLSQYIKGKLKMLQEEFCLKLSATEITHMQSLKTERQVDNYAKSLLNAKL